MKKTIIFLFICSILMIIISICLLTCNGKSEGERTYSDTTVNKTVVSGGGKVDSIPVPYEVEVPFWLRDTIRDTSYIVREFSIDTMAIIADYFTKRKYNIPYSDSLTKINADITVCENKIQSVDFTYQYTRYDTTITNTKIITPKWNIAIGFSGNYYFKNNQPGISITAGLDYKKNRFMVGYDPFNNSAQLGYQYKILNSKK